MKLGRPRKSRTTRRECRLTTVLTVEEAANVERLRGSMPASLWIRDLISAAVAQAARDARKAA